MTRVIAKTLFSVLFGGAFIIAASPASAAHIEEETDPAVESQLLFPIMNPERGRNIFVNRGCIACHSINGSGGDIGPALDPPADNRVMNPFSFAANMWNHAPGMIAAQEDTLGEQLQFTGEELADIIAFIHDSNVEDNSEKIETEDPEIAESAGVRLIMPFMSPERGKVVFVNKGCAVCHSINGVGGEDAPPMDAHTEEKFVNPFSLAAKMWDHASGMIAAQEYEMGEQLIFTGQELADITSFLHDKHAQRDFMKSDLPPRITRLISEMMGEAEED